MRELLVIVTVACAWNGAAKADVARPTIEPVMLTCEYREDSLGVDVEKPRLSWKLQTGSPTLDVHQPRGQRQTAYQVLVASNEKALTQNQGDLWDSGKVLSDESVHVQYAGTPLEARQQCFWKVRIWDEKNTPSPWSASASWTMGVLGGWKGAWIAARDVPMKRPSGQSYIPAKEPPGNFKGSAPVRREAVLMRRDVTLSARPVRAVARVTALGFVDFTVNGKKPDEARVMAPALSDCTKRVYYDTYDVTELLRAGRNTFGAIVGNGFFSTPGRGWGNWYGAGNEPVFSVEVELVLPDGTRRFLGSDGSWKWSTGEITFNDFFVGESQDLRLAQAGWNLPGFDDRKWQPVVVVAAPPGRLEANPGAPVRMTEVVKPARVEGNRYVFDAMYTGWPCIRVRGKAGQEVRFGDHGKPRGQGGSWNPNGNSADYKFTLKGDGIESLEPRFMVHTIGPVISVEGIEPSAIEAVTIKRAGADLRRTGEFSCSNPFLNQVYEATVRTHRNYTLDIPMDPTREKAGWTQDVQTMIDSTVYMTDMAALYRRWWIDMSDSQTPDGASGSVAPMCWGGQEHCWDDPWWSGMIVYLPFKHYQYYGDKQVLAEAYGPMKAYLEWLGKKADKSDGLLHWSGASDWIEVGINGWGPPKRTPTYLVSTCAWYLYADMVSHTARILGKPDEAMKYAQLATKIKDNFNKRCFDPKTGLYAGATDSQSALILPLCLGMVPDGKRSLVVKALEDNIHNKRKDHLSTGFVGTPYLMEGLHDLGMAELSYKIVTRQDYPSWKTLITDGVMKETWNGGLAQMPSLGGSVGQWFFKAVGGIRPDPTRPGFKRIFIKPSIMGDLMWVRCSYDSNYGRITSNWKREGPQLTMEVVVPPNTTATVFVPAKDASAVTEGGKPANKAEGVKFLRKENDAAVYEVGSGYYHFETTLEGPRTQKGTGAR